MQAVASPSGLGLQDALHMAAGVAECVVARSQARSKATGLGLHDVLAECAVARSLARSKATGLCLQDVLHLTAGEVECAVVRSHTRSKAMLGLASHGLLV